LVIVDAGVAGQDRIRCLIAVPVDAGVLGIARQLQCSLDDHHCQPDSPINLLPDGRFTPLAPTPLGQTPVYDDKNKGIDGRNINDPGEPVRIFTSLGGRFCNLGVSATDGRYRISAGANPGKD
jgi:hypothetical protein